MPKVTMKFCTKLVQNFRIQDALSTREQLKERMELLQKELRETKRLMNRKKDE